MTETDEVSEQVWDRTRSHARPDGEHRMKRLLTTGLMVGFALVCAASLQAQQAAKPKMGTAIPAEITTPDKVETRLGTLEFFDGAPSDATVQTVYDHLDFIHGVEVF